MKYIVSLIVLVILQTAAYSNGEEEIYLVSGAGYKAPVNEIVNLYYKEKGKKINAVFGNMKMITAYIHKSDNVSLIIGDMNFIKESKIKVIDTAKIGNGKLLLVYQFSLNVKKIKDLLNNNIKRIGIPDPKKAIYGKAAVELFRNEGIYEKIKDKLIILKTVPQVSAYLLSSNIDVGLINITDYIKIKNNKLSSIDISNDKYDKIFIQAGLIKKDAKEFYDFLKTESSKKVFKKYGL